MIEPAIRGTRYVMTAAADTGVKRVVLTSSIGTVYMNPYRTMPEMLISDALICDLDLKRVTNMLSATRVNTTRHWYAVAYGK